MNFRDSHIPFYPAAHRRTDRRLQVLRNRKWITIAVVATILVAAIIAAVLCIYFLVIKRSHQAQGGSNTLTTTPIPWYNTNHPDYCVDRQFDLTADILYSFDCYNVTDDISGAYNGIAAAYLRPGLSNATLQNMLPSYIIPDYSGQGSALKLNASYAYQYIQLVRSPRFFNETFTISAWVKPISSNSSVAILFAQSYQNASTFVIGLVNLKPRIRVYNTYLGTANSLVNSQWQYVSYVFSQDDLSMAIYIDGILKATGVIKAPQYGDFTIKQTTIGIADGFNQFNGIIDQLNIAFHVKNKTELLDEATLVASYTFEGIGQGNNSIFTDRSANSISATGAYLTRIIGSRLAGQSTLQFGNSNSSWFQSTGFALLVTFNYTYSYAFWLNIESVSSFMSLAHLVAKYEMSTAQNNGSICLAMLVAKRVNTNSNTFRLSLYIYGSEENLIISSSQLLSIYSWNHIAVVSDINGFSLYINGTSVASSVGAGLSAIQINNQQRLTLTMGNPARSSIDNSLSSSICYDSSQSDSSQNVFDMDNLRFYSRALKVGEIQALANDELSPTQYYFT